MTVDNVDKYYFKNKKENTQILHNISFSINQGEILGVVGESGSGKSTLGKLLTKIEPFQNGEIYFKGRSISGMSKKELKNFRRNVQVIFQDPDSSLNPRMKVYDIILEGVRGFDIPIENEKEFVSERLKEVGLSSEFQNRYPSELSGGQKQRIGIARALAVSPEFIVADEPISALDVSVQAQVINLIRRLQKEKDLTFLFIGHDLNVVRYISDRTVVLYNGSVLEIAESDDLFENPIHSYTQRLINSSPSEQPNQKPKINILEERPDYGPVKSYQQINENHIVALH
ncbi:ABC transporter ATP-binding protein [Macrococcus psychrotolerans]|uniref:ABC transporter ATP-binding protein n=1 Tax=Macrococcus psychrotolerans TaxID=3039389 RepID=A0AAU6RBV2_9STAP